MINDHEWAYVDPIWRLADALTVAQAAALIAEVEPSALRFRNGLPSHFEDEYGLTGSDGISSVRAAFSALVNAINEGDFPATIRRDARMKGWDEWHKVGEAVRALRLDEGDVRDGYEAAVIYCEAPNWEASTVRRSDLVAWLESRGFRSGFFFPGATSTPEYLDPKNPRYAHKLAAAVQAWLSVTDPVGKHPKQALDKWLREHAARYGMTDEDGKLNETAIEEVAKVANWKPGGGAPKTPGG